MDRERVAAKISILKSLRSRARPERLPLYQPPTTFAVTYRPPPPSQMGAADGYLFYSCQGARAADLSHMPAWLLKVRAACTSLPPPLLTAVTVTPPLQDVQTRLPLYLQAPSQVQPRSSLPPLHAFLDRPDSERANCGSSSDANSSRVFARKSHPTRRAGRALKLRLQHNACAPRRGVLRCLTRD